MTKRYVKRAGIFIVVAFVSFVSAGADIITWDFAGGFNSVSGLGCSQPGARVGASITGSMTIANSDSITAYPTTPPSPNETATVFGITGPANLNLTLSFEGNSYNYSGSFYLLMYNGVASVPIDEFWFPGSCTQNLIFQIHLVESRTGSGPTAPTLSSFLDGTDSLPPTGNTALVALADRYLGNSISGNLTLLDESLTPVPEPSTLSLLALCAAAILVRCRKSAVS
jgi:hypothetical protein